MKLFLFALGLILAGCNIFSQNKTEFRYNSVYAEDLCAALMNDPDIVLLDVRSAGEYDDTSHIASLNLGRFKNSINIDISNIENRLDEIRKFKNKKIFVYCSHSNRSRVVSDLLIDSGFTNIYNVNGGISNWVHDNPGCAEFLYTNNLPYKLYPPREVKSYFGNSEYQIIDIRPADEFNGKSDKQFRNVGNLQNMVNIPSEELEKRLNELDKNKKIILIDFDFSLSPKAAVMLTGSGFQNVGVMVYGLYSWLVDFPSNENLLANTSQYKILPPPESVTMIMNNPDVVLLDVRSEEEFKSKSETGYKNIGYLKNAVNIPLAELEKRIGELEKYKGKEILVYDFSREGSSSTAADLLVKKGFAKVNVLLGGLYGLSWRQKNIKNFPLPKEFIVS